MTELTGDNNTIQPTARKEWVEPTLTAVSAGSAEFTVGPTDDGPDVS